MPPEKNDMAPITLARYNPHPEERPPPPGRELVCEGVKKKKKDVTKIKTATPIKTCFFFLFFFLYRRRLFFLLNQLGLPLEPFLIDLFRLVFDIFT